ncbi:acetolactate synthase large subunit [Leucobacter sp. BZR 635]
MITEHAPQPYEVPIAERRAAEAAGVAPENTGLAILRVVRAHGVDTIFGIPGTHNLEFYRHLPRLGMRAVTTRHEQGAGYAADAWAQRTDLPGVVIATSGPGLLNALSSAGTAYCESRPMLILAPGPARGREGSTIGTLHETKNQLGAASAVVDMAVRVTSAEEAVEAAHAAFEVFRGPRPRPVYIEVPLDLLEEAASFADEQLAVRAPAAPGLAQAEEIRAAAELLVSAQRPAILAGRGSRKAREELLALAEHLGAPVVTSSNGKGVVRESHPLAVGAQLRLSPAVGVLDDADVLLVVGSKVALGEFSAGPLAPRGSVIRIDADAQQIEVGLPVTNGIVGRSELEVPRLLEAVLGVSAGRPAPEPWCDVAAVRDACAREAMETSGASVAVAARMVSAFPPGVIVTGDSSQISYNGIAEAFRAEAPAECINMITYATLGYGVPAAIGAKLASPDRPVVCVTGDGALMFSVVELLTAAEQGLDITVVCVDNGGYGEIQQNEEDRGIAPIAVQLTQPDWPALAQSLGGTGFAVGEASALESVVAGAIATPGVSLVHVPMHLFE